MLKLSAILLFALALAACSGSGGGSDGGNDPVDDTSDNNSSEVTLQAIAGPDQSVNEGEEVVLEGSSEVSDTNLSLSYSWEQVGGSAVTLSGADNRVASFSPIVDADSELNFRLLVQTDTGIEATDELVVSVNNAPTAIIEGVSSVAEGLSVSLNGRQSFDSDDGSIVFYEWSQLGGNSVELVYEDHATVSFAAPLVNGDENLSFELAVTDDDSAVGRSTFIVEVMDDTENPAIAAVYLDSGDYGIGTSMAITLTAIGAESNLMLRNGSSFNGQELTDFAPVSGQDGNYTAIYTVAETDPSQDDGASVSANIILVDPAGNESAAIAEVALDGVSIDTLPPELDSISVSAGDYGIGASVEITVVAANAETDLSLRVDSSFNGETLTDFTAVEGKDGYYTAIYTVASGNLDLSPAAEANMSLTVLDTAGNESLEYVTTTLSDATSIDANAPVITSVGVASGDHGIGKEIRISITASDTEIDLILSPDANSFNGRTLIQFGHIDSGIYSAIYTVSEGDDDVASNSSVNTNIALVDAHGNVGATVASVLLSNSSIDATRPQLSALSISDGVYGIASDVVIFLSAAENESGLELQDSTFNGNSLAGFSDLQDGLYALTYTVASGDSDQADGADVAANITVVDSVGNTSLSITAISLDGESIDANAPIIESISVAAGDHGIGDAVEIVINTSEADLALAAGSTFNGHVLTGFGVIGDPGNDYVVTYTVIEGDSDVSDGSSVVTDIAFIDAAQNLGLSTQSALLKGAAIDANRPEIASVAVDGGKFGVGDDVVVTLTVVDSEVGLTTLASSSFNGGTLNDISDNGDGTYSTTYTVSEGDLDIADGGTVITDIAFTDDAGNVGASIESLLFAGTSIDANSPSIALVSVAAGSYGVGAVIPVTITASAKELGLSLASSLFNGNNLTNITDNLDGNYSASYTVEEGDADVADGSAVTINLAFEDAYANVGAAKESLILSGASIDANSPTITSVSVATGTFIIGDDVLITITAGDSENGLALKSDSSFNGQQLSDFSATDQDGVYTAVYTVAAEDTSFADGDTVSLDIALLDAVGNESAAVTTIELSGTTIDTIVPSIYEVSVSSDNIVNSSDDLSKVSVTGSTSNVEDGRPLTLDIGGITTETSVIADDDDNGGFSTTVDLASLSDGTYPITIDVADISGNKAHFTGDFIKDTEAPTIDSVVVSADDVINSSDTLSAVAVSVSTTGVEDGQKVSLNISGVMLEVAITSNGFDGVVDLSELGDGTEIVVSGDVYDVAGNAASTFTKANFVIKDTVAPSIDSVTISTDDVINSSDTLSAVAVSVVTTGVEDGQVVSLDIGGVPAEVSITSNGFDGTVDLSGLGDGTEIVVSGDVSDVAGNAAATFTKASFVIKDTVAPSIDSVTISTDDVINSSDTLSAVAVSVGTTGVEDGQKVSLDIGGVKADVSITSKVFDGTVDLSELGEGTDIVVSGEVSDAAGNAAAIFTKASFVIKDTVAPSIDSVTISTDDVINSSDTLSAVLISVGTTGVEDGQKVSLDIGGVMLELAITSNGFDGTVDLSGLGDGTEIVVSGEVSDVAGNASETFAKANFVIKDTVAPSIDSVIISADDVINSSDTLSAVAVSVVTTGVEDSQKVSLDIGGVTADVSITNNGFDGTVDLSELGEGTDIVVSGEVSDAAGNAAAIFTKASFVIKDTVAPSIDSVTISTDDVINSSDTLSAVLISVGTTGAEDGQVVSLDVDGVTADVSITSNGFDGTVDLSELGEGTDIVVSGEVSDAAGNAAAIFTKASFVIKDTVAPSIDSVTISTDDVINSSDTLSAVLISVGTTGVEDGQVVSLDVDGVTADVSITSNGFNGTVDLSGLGDGTEIVVSGEVSDAAGNAAATFTKASFVIKDTVAPGMDSVTISTDDVINSSDILSAVAVSVSTTGVEDGQVVSLDIDGITADVAIASNAFNGTVNLSGLEDGTEIVVSGEVSDAAGNAAATFTKASFVIKDTVAPSIDSVTISTDDVINSSDTLSAVAVSVGTTGVEDGQKVSLDIGGVKADVSITSKVFDGTVDLSELGEGTDIVVSGEVSDAAGNAAAIFTKASFVIKDTVAPSIDSVTISTDDVINSSDTLSAVLISVGTTGVEDGQVVSLDVDGVTADVSITSNGFDGTVDLSELGEGTDIVVSGEVSDAAGNAAAIFTKASFVIKDTVAPSIDSVTISTDDVINSSDTLSAVLISVGTTGVEDGQVVSLDVDGVTADVSITSNGFNGTVDLSGLGEGTDIVVSGEVSDAAGNSAATFTKANFVIKDTVAPGMDSVTISTDDVINSSDILSAVAVSVSTTGVEDGQVVSLDVDGVTADVSITSNGFDGTVDLSELGEGTDIVVSGEVSDAAGNAAAIFTKASFVIKDTVAPSIDSVTISTDDVINSSDTLSAVLISVGTTGVEDGQVVSLDVDGVTADVSITSNGFNGTVDLSGLGEGTDIVVSGEVSDAAGNSAATFTKANFVIKDTVAPSIDSVTISTDDVINSSDTLSAVAVSVGTTGVEDGQVVSLDVDGVTADVSITSNGFDGTVDLSELGEGTDIVVSGEVSDAAGNAAAIFTKASFVIKDTVAPSIDSVTISTDDVINSSDTLSAVAVSVGTTGVEDGQKVSLDIGGVTADVSITNNGFDGTVDLSGLEDGTEIVVSGEVSDAAGNAAATFTKASFVIKDTVAPSIDSVTISTDDVINSSDTLSAVLISVGTTGVEDGQKVSLDIGGVKADVSITSKVFDGTVDLSELGEGTDIVVSGEVSDAAGNAAAIFTKASFVIKDTVAPSIDSVTISTDDVINSSDTLSAVAVSVGTTGVEDGQKLSLSVGGITTEVSITSDGFDGTVDLSELGEGTDIVVSGEVSDAAGNAAAIFTKASFVIKDTVAPSIDSVTISTDDVINSSDTLSAVLISVGTTGVEDGQVVSLDVDGVTADVSITSNGFDGTVDLSELGEGTDIVVSGEVSDAAGNAAAIFTKASFVIKDTVAPSIDSVTISTDDVINSSDTLSAVAVSVGTTGVEDGQKVSLDIGGVKADVSITSKVFDGTVDLSELGEGTDIVVSGEVSDAAGNAAAIFTKASFVIKDTVAPSIDSVTISTDDVINSSDTLSAVLISVGTTGVEDGQVVSLDVDGVTADVSITSNGFNGTVDLSGLGDGTEIVVSGEVSDAAGNAAATFTKASFVIKDTVAPGMDSVTISTDDVINSSDILSAVAVSVSTTGVEDGQVVSLDIDGITADVAIASNAFNGTVNLSGLEDGTEIVVSGEVSDAAGNAAATFTKASFVIKDTVAPGMDSVTISTDDVINSSDILSAVAVSVSTTGVEDGQVVSLDIDGITADVAIASNAFNGTVNLSGLEDGTEIVVSGEVSDAAGNAAATFTKASFVIKDTVAPSIDSVTISTDDVINSSDTLSAVAVSVGTTGVEDGQKVSLDIGGVKADVSITSKVFDGTVDLSELGEGTDIVVSGEVSDAAGNAAAIFTKASFVIKDTVAPSIDSVTISTDDVINSSDTLSAVLISVGTTGVEDGQVVSLDVDGVTADVSITSNGFDGTVDLSELGEGTDIVVSGEVSDAAGNAAATFTKASFVIKDTVAPSIDSVTISTDDVINSSDTLSAVLISVGTTGVEDGQVVSLDIDGVTADVSITSNGFDGTVDLSELGEGTDIVVSGEVSDAAGNAAAIFTKASFVIKDTVAPSIDSVTISTDDVINSSDTLSAVEVSVGTTGVEDDQKVSLDIGGVKADVSITSNGFDGTVDLSELGEGTDIVVSGEVSDAAGNAAAIFTKASFVIKDTVAPSIDSVIISADDVINSSDTLSAVAVSVVTTGVEDGQKVSLNIGGVTADVVITSNAFDGTVDLSELGEGTDIVVSGEVSDAAGNSAATFTKANFVIKDTVAPSIDSVTISTDDVINSSDTLSAVAVSVGTTGVEDGQVVSLDVDGVTADVSITSNGFDGTVDLSELGEGTDIVVSGEVSDAAGNAAAIFTKASFVIKDTVAPSIDSVTISTDDVINSSDTLSAVAVSVGTTGVEDGQKVSLDIGGVTADVSITNNGFDGTVDLSGLEDGTEIVVSGEVSDAAGNAAATFTKASFVIKDTVAPSIDSVTISTDDVINSSEH